MNRMVYIYYWQGVIASLGLRVLDINCHFKITGRRKVEEGRLDNYRAYMQYMLSNLNILLSSRGRKILYLLETAEAQHFVCIIGH